MTQPTLSDTDQHEPSRLRRAVLFACAGEGLLTLMDTIVKSLTPTYPIFQIAFLRFACGAVLATLFWRFMRAGPPSRDALRFHGLRGVLSVVIASAFFYGLSKVPIAEAMALSFLAPLFIALFGVLLLKERFDSRIGLALAGGLIGMAIIVSGQYGGGAYTVETLKGVIAITGSAIGYAAMIILLRARAALDPIPVIILLQNTVPAVLLIPLAASVWAPLSLADFGKFAFVGLLGVSGHLCLTHAFARAEAARLAPVHYTILLWGILFGIVFFGEWPGLFTLLGAAFIIASTLLTQKR